MSQRFFVTDLDGTLLRSDISLSDYTTTVLQSALAEGHGISFATARSWISARKVVGHIPWRYLAVIYNGALLLDPSTGEFLSSFVLPTDLSNEIIELGRKHGVIPFAFSIDLNGVEKALFEPYTTKFAHDFGEARKNDPRMWMVDKVQLPRGFQAIDITYLGTEEELRPIRQLFEDTFGGAIHTHLTLDTYIKGCFMLEVGHPQANKRDGLLAWAQLMGCDPGDITVFGDNLNDVGLFQAGGVRIAVSNAHTELQAMADRVIGSNDEDGVAHYIWEQINGQSSSQAS